MVTPEVMKLAKKKMIVMHPLPRVNEIRYSPTIKEARFQHVLSGIVA
jgi:aspartate carbamoyltransferase catalytic subunit